MKRSRTTHPDTKPLFSAMDLSGDNPSPGNARHLQDDDVDDLASRSRTTTNTDTIPQSLQGMHDPPMDDDDDISSNMMMMSPQEAANQLFCNSEILAPMVRASTTPLRTLAISHGASLVYTEELIDRSILTSERIVNTELGTIDYRVPRHNFSLKVQRRMAADTKNRDSQHGAILLRIDPLVERNKLIYQIGTGESGLALQAATKVIADVNGIDINMGCPKKFSVSGGMGSALLSDTSRACDILSTLRRNISKPLSAKIRLLDPDDPRPTIDFVKALIHSGANAITIHGRIVGDESQFPARWKTLIEVVQQLKQTESSRNVPIIVNGDLYTRADIHEMKHRSGCDGIMLARPALYNISLFRKGKDKSLGGTNNNDDDDDYYYDRTPQSGLPIHQFQTFHHAGYYGYHSPLLHPRTSIVQEYLSYCQRYRTHSNNAKYVVCEMMNTRRAPTHRVPFLNMSLQSKNSYEGKQSSPTIAEVCRCKSLEDLLKLWDVNQHPHEYHHHYHQEQHLSSTLPLLHDHTLPSRETSNLVTHETEAMAESTRMDLHNYDDTYFLDHETFLKKRRVEGGGEKVCVIENDATTTVSLDVPKNVSCMENGIGRKE